jgi:rSAM/selenodomain-associated transferase 2
MNISVILPVLNEAQVLPKTLERLSGINPFEIIVVDGGSRDDSREIARWYTPHVWVERPGRGRQMNAGARRATGKILLFLHADAWIDPGGLEALTTLLAGSPQVVGGAFRLGIDSRRLALRLIVAAANLRARLGFPYGDQGIFVRKEIFDRIGGFPEIPLMEEIGLIRNLRREGKMAILRNRVTVSPRRWESEGVIFATVRNCSLLLLYLVGVPPERLHRWYSEVR